MKKNRKRYSSVQDMEILMISYSINKRAQKAWLTWYVSCVFGYHTISKIQSTCGCWLSALENTIWDTNNNKKQSVNAFVYHLFSKYPQFPGITYIFVVALTCLKRLAIGLLASEMLTQSLEQIVPVRFWWTCDSEPLVPARWSWFAEYIHNSLVQGVQSVLVGPLKNNKGSQGLHLCLINLSSFCILSFQVVQWDV